MQNNNLVSIIIPTLNSKRYIRDCLNSLSNLNFPKNNMEIIVVDGGSTDDTVNITRNFNIKLFKKTDATISSLRNLGADNAKGDILAFIDSDCIAHPDWLKNAVDLLNTKNIEAIGEEYRLPVNPSWTEKIWDINIARRRKNGETRWLPSGNLIMLKSCFLKIGGFNQQLSTSEDVDLCNRLRKAGFKIISDDKIIVVHLGNPKTIREFFLKELWRGKGSFQNFLYSLPRIQLTKAISLAFMMLFCFFGLIISFIAGIIINNWFAFFIFLLTMMMAPMILAVKTLLKNPNRHYWYYVFPLALLYFVYSVSRTLCILDYRNWQPPLGKHTKIPVLLYHNIREDEFDIKKTEPGLRPYILKKSDFEKQMRFLKNWGYERREMTEERRGKKEDRPSSIVRHPSVIVFDDGWESNYKIAYPILKQYGLRATFFVTIENIGKSGMMAWEQIKEMANDGMTIGSHSMTHRPPIELSDEELKYELKESKRILEENLGIKIDSFSSPTGFYDKRIINIAKEAGYKQVYFSKVSLSEISSNGNLSVLNKIGIKRGCSMKTFKAIVRGDMQVLANLRSNQVLRDTAKAILGAKLYHGIRGLMLRGMREEGRRTRDDGRGTRDDGRRTKEEGRGKIVHRLSSVIHRNAR